MSFKVKFAVPFFVLGLASFGCSSAISRRAVQVAFSVARQGRHDRIRGHGRHDRHGRQRGHDGGGPTGSVRAARPAAPVAATGGAGGRPAAPGAGRPARAARRAPAARAARPAGRAGDRRQRRRRPAARAAARAARAARRATAARAARPAAPAAARLAAGGTTGTGGAGGGNTVTQVQAICGTDRHVDDCCRHGSRPADYCTLYPGTCAGTYAAARFTTMPSCEDVFGVVTTPERLNCRVVSPLQRTVGPGNGPLLSRHRHGRRLTGN